MRKRILEPGKTIITKDGMYRVSNVLETRRRPHWAARLAAHLFAVSVLALGTSSAIWATVWLWVNLP